VLLLLSLMLPVPVSQTDDIMTAHSSYWPFVFNLANSIIGVAVLALPFCFKEVLEFFKY